MASNIVVADPPLKFDPDALGLALSGGGFRASLFHLGVLERLYVMRILDDVRYFSSVSGGSIVGAYVVLNWDQLLKCPEEGRSRLFDEVIAQPIIRLTKMNIRNRILLKACLPCSWRKSFAELLGEALNKHLFKNAVLGNFPSEDRLRVAINSTNLWTGKRFRFARNSMGDYHMGYSASQVETTRVSTAVAASAAFPPLFSPMIIPVTGPFNRWSFGDNPKPIQCSTPAGGKIALTDGGVYDNVGLNAVRQRCGKVIAVDAGLPLGIKSPEFGRFSAQLRTVDVMMSQIVSHTVKRFVDDLISGKAKGVLIRSSQTTNHLATVEAGCPKLALESVPGLTPETVDLLSNIRTDLDEFSDLEISTLIYHGRSVADAAIRRFQPMWIRGLAQQIPSPPILSQAHLVELAKGSSRKMIRVLALLKRDEVKIGV